jgi:hypothetical protein
MYYELVSIDVKPEKDGWYALINVNYEYAGHKGYFQHSILFQNGEWVSWPRTPITHYLRPLLPTASDEKEAEKYADEVVGKPTCTRDKLEWNDVRNSFLAGKLHERASGKKGDGECDHPWAFVQTKCNGEINKCLKCGKELGAY